MRKFIERGLVFGIFLIIVGCASTPPDPTQKPPGFLPDYSLLKPMSSPDEDMKFYSYKNPKVNRSDYHAAIIDPVSLYQTATASGVTSAQIESARAEIDSGIKKIISKKIEVTDKPGPGVFRVQVMITGATLEKDSIKPWNIMPISAAIKMASMATGVDNKTPAMVVELKIVDSKTNTLLKEVVTTITGDSFRLSSNTGDEFAKLATKWVEQALKYSNK